MSKSNPTESHPSSRVGRVIRVALAGNPNCGKTTVFNNLTGAHQHVGNYPGVTVEHKEGGFTVDGRRIHVTDLPGTYSLTAYSTEELIARNYVVHEVPDVIVDVVDASNLERNLYLAVQLMELGQPMIIALNMHDLARRRGLEIDIDRLSKLLGVLIVPTVGHRDEGTDELIQAILKVADEPESSRPVRIGYGKELNREISRVAGRLTGQVPRHPPRWLALKLLEGDAEVEKLLAARAPDLERVVEQVEHSTARLKSIFGEDPEILLADARYGFISGACQEAVKSTVESRHDISDRVDAVLTNRVLAFPIFLGMMWLVFQLTFAVGEPLQELLKWLFALLSRGLSALLPDGMFQSLLVDGIIAGVGGVLVFLPNILFLFLAISVLEDSGYMARAAFIMDRLMHRIGLHGKSFIPMLIGFGCTVPAVMATRTLESRRDRIITILITPLMSCGARFPVYALLAGAFFSESQGNVIFSIYLLGIALAIIMAKIFGKWLLPGMSAPFVMELPPYRVPTLKGLLIHMWERGWLYLKKAGTIILAFSVIVWILSNFPKSPEIQQEYQTRIESAPTEELKTELTNEMTQQQLAYSFAGRVGRTIEPVLRPIGLGNWRIGTALFAGLGAKEIVVSTIGTLYSLGEQSEESDRLKQTLRDDHTFTPLAAYALMVFVLVYIPCLAVVAVVKRETNSWRWPIFMVTYTTTLAWVVSGLVYWGGWLLGFGA